jgi:hypothetical protein
MLLFGVGSVVPKDTGETEMQLAGKIILCLNWGIETIQIRGEGGWCEADEQQRCAVLRVLEGAGHEVRMFLLCEQADAGSLETEVQDSSGRLSGAQTDEGPGFVQLAPGVPGRVGAV